MDMFKIRKELSFIALVIGTFSARRQEYRRNVGIWSSSEDSLRDSCLNTVQGWCTSETQPEREAWISLIVPVKCLEKDLENILLLLLLLVVVVVIVVLIVIVVVVLSVEVVVVDLVVVIVVVVAEVEVVVVLLLVLFNKALYQKKALKFDLQSIVISRNWHN